MTVSYALQSVFEALDQLTAAVPEHKRAGYRDAVKRVQRARVELSQWVDAHR
jgi:hypothetical protein